MQILKRDTQYDVLPKVIIENELKPLNYELAFGAQGRIYLQEIDPIKLPVKIYSNDKDFIEHVGNTWAKGDGNLGICLVGGKGLGKSLTGNIIAKKLDIPVIRITSSLHGNGAFSFLNEIKQDFCLFIDEFEKLFNSDTSEDIKTVDTLVSQEDFLSFLDGGSVRENRIVFIITSNSDYKINSYLKNRPSRLKYLKEYNDMEDVIIREIIDDLLVNKDFAPDLLDNLPYEGLNTDVLIQIIKEINDHNKPYSSFKSFFNFRKTSKDYYTFYAPVGKNDEYVSVGKVNWTERNAGNHVVSQGGNSYYTKDDLDFDGQEKSCMYTMVRTNSKGKQQEIENCYFKIEEIEKLTRAYAGI